MRRAAVSARRQSSSHTRWAPTRSAGSPDRPGRRGPGTRPGRRGPDPVAGVHDDQSFRVFAEGRGWPASSARPELDHDLGAVCVDPTGAPRESLAGRERRPGNPVSRSAPRRPATDAEKRDLGRRVADPRTHSPRTNTPRPPEIAIDQGVHVFGAVPRRCGRATAPRPVIDGVDRHRIARRHQRLVERHVDLDGTCRGGRCSQRVRDDLADASGRRRAPWATGAPRRTRAIAAEQLDLVDRLVRTRAAQAWRGDRRSAAPAGSATATPPRRRGRAPPPPSRSCMRRRPGRRATSPARARRTRSSVRRDERGRNAVVARTARAPAASSVSRGRGRRARRPPPRASPRACWAHASATSPRLISQPGGRGSPVARATGRAPTPSAARTPRESPPSP